MKFCKSIKLSLLIRRDFWFSLYMKKIWKLFSYVLGVMLAILFVNCRFDKAYAWNYGEDDHSGCMDVNFVFVRGSGQAMNNNKEFLEFKERMIEIAERLGIKWGLFDLKYPATAVTFDNALGIYSSAGKATNFAESVWTGVIKLRDYIKNRSRLCAKSYYVLGGYSQGALVIQEALKDLASDRVIYIGLFGDPKLYLPEGEGLIPPACLGRDYSRYRVMVGDCRTDNGSLGARKPYEVATFAGRYGLFCNDDDFICGSSINPLVNDGHLRYVDTNAIYTMSRIVEHRIKYIRVNGSYYLTKSRQTELADIEDEVILLPSATKYELVVGDNVSFDVSQSFAVSGASLSYAWELDRQILDEHASVLSYSFDSVGGYELKVRAWTDSGAESEKLIKVIVRDSLEDMRTSLSKPKIEATKRGEDSFRMTWSEVPDEAKSVAIKIGDVFLGYADVLNGEIVIEDYDFELPVYAAYANESGDISEWVEVVIDDDLNESANTTTSLDWWRVASFVLLPFAIVGLILSVIRLIEDLKALKSAQSNKP